MHHVLKYKVCNGELKQQGCVSVNGLQLGLKGLKLLSRTTEEERHGSARCLLSIVLSTTIKFLKFIDRCDYIINSQNSNNLL